MKRMLALVIVVALTGACGGDDDDDGAAPEPTTSGTAADSSEATTTSGESGSEVAIVFNGQGNDLAAYEAEPPFTEQIVIPHYDEAEEPDGLDINAQICFDPENPRRFVAGEDTLQDTTGEPGWGIFELEGDRVGELAATQIGKLVPTYQPSNDNPENYGCGFLPDGRIVTTDIGNQAEGDGDGQLIVWFEPFDSFEVEYCKVDIGLATAQSALVDGEYVYVAQARGSIERFAIDALPTSATADGGCDSTDATGAPMTTTVVGEPFITPDPASGIGTPAGIAKGPDGQFYVSSVFTGVISEFDADGTFVRAILTPPPGEALGAVPFSTGTPLGIGVGPDGSVYYADIGIVVSDDGIGPGNGTGKVRRITFDGNGEPQPPEVMDDGLAFPDGIGIWIPVP